MTAEPELPLVVMICDDLMFTSKVSSAARAFGGRFVSSRTMTLDSKNLETARCVIIDLQNPGLDLAAFLTRLLGSNKPLVVAYAPHVNAESLKSARAAGCDHVLTRGQFVDELDSLIRNALAK